MAKRLIRTEKWTKNKPKLPAYISVWLALKSNEAFNLRAVKRETDFFDSNLSDLKRWYRYYDEPTFALQDLFDSLANLVKLIGYDDKTGILSSTCNFFKAEPEQQTHKLKMLGIESENDVDVTAKKYMPDIEAFIKNFLLNDFILLDIDEETMIENPTAFFNAQPMAFAFGVLIQSLLEYQVSPFVLYQQSIQGNLNALECLVSLDKNIITHPEIAPIWASLSSTPSGYYFQRITKALSTKPKSKMTTKSIKTTNVALIELIFYFCNESGWIDRKIPRTHIFDLFDNVARDLEGKLYDDDFPDTPEARDRAVNREKKRIGLHLQALGLLEENE